MKKLFNIPVLVLILSNLYPVYAVYNKEMTAFSVVVLYMLETLIVTFYTILKAKKLKGGGFSETNPLWLFILAYSVMTFASLGFFLAFMGIWFSSSNSSMSVWSFFNTGLLKSFLFLFLSHGVSYYLHYINKKKYLRAEFKNLFALPYKRIYVQTITVVVGGIILGMAKGAVAYMLVLMIIKIILDIKAHLKSHTIMVQ